MKDKLKYTYLVAYDHSKGTGRCIISMPKKINSTADIITTEATIAKHSGTENVSINNFILLETKWGFLEYFTAITELLVLVFSILLGVSMIVAVFV